VAPEKTEELLATLRALIQQNRELLERAHLNIRDIDQLLAQGKDAVNKGRRRSSQETESEFPCSPDELRRRRR